MRSANISEKQSLPRDKHCFAYPFYRRYFKKSSESLQSEGSTPPFFHPAVMGVGGGVGSSGRGRGSSM